MPSAESAFERNLTTRGLDLSPRSVATLQVNVTKQCNQACRHCHVDSSPSRREHISRELAEHVVAILRAGPAIQTLDLTGGAPELNPHFEYLVQEARRLDRRVLVRHNLTVSLDPHPEDGRSMAYLPEFFAEQRVVVISSLPYYQAFFTDRQRGQGVFEKSIAALKRLNSLGYGQDTSELELNLVYNPAGAFLPGNQRELELDFKNALWQDHGIRFNQLYAITNMPIHRFRDDLARRCALEEYMNRLKGAFNPEAAREVMCRDMVSVAHDGTLYDCDFNQMLELPVLSSQGRPANIMDFTPEAFLKRGIRFADHCFGCTAGAGSSCGGEVA